MLIILVQSEVIQGAIYSILVMIDKEDNDLAYNYLIDLVDKQTNELLQKEVALHEEFVGYLRDSEEEYQMFLLS